MFSQAEFGPFLSTAVIVDFDKAAELFDDIGERYGACDGTLDSAGNTVRVLPVSFPTIGDETFAVRVDLESDFFPVTTLFAFARQGDTPLHSRVIPRFS